MKPVAQILRRLLLQPATLLALCCGLATSLLHATTVDTLTGGPWQENPPYFGFQNGDTAGQAQFHTPYGLALDSTTTNLYVADRDNNAVRQLDIPGNWTYTFVPNPAVPTNLISQPVGVAVRADNVFVLNRGNGNNGTILQFDTLFAELIATNATGLTNAAGMAMDALGNIYVTVQSNTVIQIAPPYTNKTTIATVTNAGASLQGIAVKYSGLLAVCDSGRHGIYLINPTNGVVTTNAGFHGAGDFTDTNKNFNSSSTAKFNQPYGVAVAGDDTLIVTDTSNHRVKLVLPSGTVTNLYGVKSNVWVTGTGTYPGWWDGTVVVPDTICAVEARQPVGVMFAPDGTVYVTEQYYHLIRKITDTGLILPPPPAPAAPANLTATTPTPPYGQVVLTWSAVGGATNYILKRSTQDGGPYNTTLVNTTALTYTDTNVITGNTYYYVVSASNAGGESPDSNEVSATPPRPPVTDPQIGYVTFPPPDFYSVYHAVSSAIFNNDVDIVIIGESGTQTFYEYANTPVLTNVPNPTTNSFSAPVGYADGLYSVLGLTVASVMPDLTIKAFGHQTGRPDSATASAQFQFIVGNPLVVGDNAAQFTVGDITTGADLWYTTDGSDPTNAAPSQLAGTVIGTNLITLSLAIPPGITNLSFKARGFKLNYKPSGVVTTIFSATNFSANKISFGFEAGEASSDFVASPGQNFFAPVTLSLLPGAKMYSLQFNLTATNLTGPAITPGAIFFKSMLKKPIPGVTPIVFETIPPAMFTDGPPPTNPVLLDGGFDFMSLIFTNNSLNLLGVGWVERATKTNLYDTTTQDLITYSMAHDTMFLSSAGKVIAGGFSFNVPGTATDGQTYQIQIGRPTATSDGVGAPGSSVYIAAPTNGALAAGALNSIKTVTVGQRRYTVGNVYPFRWFNAGDFGNTNLASADVVQVFQSALWVDETNGYYRGYALNRPPVDSDFFDAMDSCCGTVDTSTNGMYTYPASLTNSLVTITTEIVTNPPVIITDIHYTNIFVALSNHLVNLTNTYYTNTTIISDGTNYTYTITNVVISTTNVVDGIMSNMLIVTFVTNAITFQTNITYDTTARLPLYDGNDTLINSVAFGDGILDIADIYVTFRRSLDPSRTWFQRFWTNGVRGAVTSPNIFTGLAAATAPPAAKNSPTGKSGGGATSSATAIQPGVIFTAGDAVTGPGLTVDIPITANILGSYPLRVLMLNLTVEPLDGSPTITTPVQFLNPALGTPYSTSQKGANNYGAVWLNTGIAGLTGSATIGTLRITLPVGAPTTAAYAINFEHASASPNGIAVFPKTAFTGLLTLGDRSTSSWNDGIPDTWRLRNFGTIYNQLSAAHADADGDGADNLKEYKAGTNPNDAKSVLRMQSPTGAFSVRWPSILGKTYIVERSTALFSGNWSPISTNSGTGGDLQIFDSNSAAGNTRFYRVRVAE